MERTGNKESRYNRFRSFAMNRMAPPEVMEEDSLMYWRVHILFTILFAASVFTLITLVPVFILVINNNLWGLGIFDLAAWFIIIMLLLARNIRFEIRSAITLVLTYLLGLVIIVNVGILSGGPLCLFGFAVFAGIFRGTRDVSFALVLNAITLTIISWLISTGRLGQTFPFFKTSEAMMAALATFMLLNIAVAISVRVLVKGLARTNQKQKALVSDLESKRSQLENTKILLELEVEKHKRSEESVMRERDFTQATIDSLPGLFYLFDDQGRFLRWNKNFEEVSGYSAQEFARMSPLDLFGGPDKKNIEEAIQKVFLTGQASVEADFLSRDQSRTPCFFTGKLFLFEGKPSLIGMGIDITERKLAEKALRESEKKYRNILENIEDGYYEVDTAGNFTFFNNSTCRILGYSADELMDKNNREYVDDENAKKIFKIYNEVYRTGIPTRAFDWQLIRKDGSKCFVETGVSLITDSNNVKIGFSGIARDITGRKRSEEELDNSFKLLRAALGGTIQALAVAVETRDPYTAGHQKNVADLSRAIATDMGLDINIIDGIRMAGAIHDLGKMGVPAEILSKPSRLSEIEYRLIKTHSQAGYDILKDIEFPWPIAQIVLQHHERLDGSGYPNGLKGDEILPEARIIAVADVVDAIAANRPYRPAFGIEKALEEITRNRGVLYAPAVVDACLSLFREKGYKF